MKRSICVLAVTWIALASMVWRVAAVAAEGTPVAPVTSAADTFAALQTAEWDEREIPSEWPLPEQIEAAVFVVAGAYQIQFRISGHGYLAYSVFDDETSARVGLTAELDELRRINGPSAVTEYSVLATAVTRGETRTYRVFANVLLVGIAHGLVGIAPGGASERSSAYQILAMGASHVASVLRQIAATPTAQPQNTPTPTVRPQNTPTPKPPADPCYGATEWWNASAERATVLLAAADDLNWILAVVASGGKNADAASAAARHRDALTTAAEEQEASAPPRAGETVNTQLVETYRAYAKVMDTAWNIIGGGANPMLADALRYHIVDHLSVAETAAATASGEIDVFLEKCPAGEVL